jgi:hypothetical protein
MEAKQPTEVKSEQIWERSIYVIQALELGLYYNARPKVSRGNLTDAFTYEYPNDCDCLCQRHNFVNA